MEKPEPLRITAAALERFARVFSCDDTFTLLYVLAKSNTPRQFEDLCRTYGSDPSEMRDRLERLIYLGLIKRRGRAYMAASDAVDVIQALEQRLKNVTLPAVTATAEALPMVRPGSLRSASPFCEATSSNGARLSVERSATAGKDVAMGTEQIQPINQAVMRAVADSAVRPNANRSQLYL